MDLSQISIANLMQLASNTNTFEIEEDMLRHMILNTLRYNILANKASYGEFVIACDSPVTSWRKEFFTYYKATRARDRAKSPVDWATFSKIMTKIIGEITEALPYPVVRVDGAEGDDIIGVLTMYLNAKKQEPIKILSGDKDFIQLQRLPGVSQYNPVSKVDIFHDNADFFLFEQIVRGDRIDGIPNIKSQDDVFIIDGIRQKSVMAKDIEAWYADGKTVPGELLDKYKRNEKLIDLRGTPRDLAMSIVDSYQKQQGKKSHIREYFMDKGLRQLLQNSQDF